MYLQKILYAIEEKNIKKVKNLSMYLNICHNRVILFGAGKLGRGILKILRETGIEPIAFCDNNKKDKEIDGVPIVDRQEAIFKYGQDTLFIISMFDLYLWGKDIDPRSDLLKTGCKYVEYYSYLFWHYGKIKFEQSAPVDWILSPSEILSEKDKIINAYGLFEVESQERYINVLKSRLFCDNGWQIEYAESEPHFCDLIQIEKNECFVDCGGFDGDTLEEFIKKTPENFKKYFFVEAMKQNIEKLCAKKIYLNNKNKIDLIPYAAWDNEENMYFEYNGGASCSKKDYENKEILVKVQSVKLDDYLINQDITWIKMDIEGAELRALKGLEKTIMKCRPKLSICLYHRSNDLWQIPLLIDSFVANYKYYLRIHKSGDIICYAMPT